MLKRIDVIYLFTKQSVLVSTHYFYEDEKVYIYTEYGKSTYLYTYHISNLNRTIPCQTVISIIPPPKNEWVYYRNDNTTEKTHDAIKLRIVEIIFQKLSENH